MPIEALVAVGFLLCLIPVGIGVAIANWSLPYVPPPRDGQRVQEMLAAQETDVFCGCSQCADRRMEREISDRWHSA